MESSFTFTFTAPASASAKAAPKAAPKFVFNVDTKFTMIPEGPKQEELPTQSNKRSRK